MHPVAHTLIGSRVAPSPWLEGRKADWPPSTLTHCVGLPSQAPPFIHFRYPRTGDFLYEYQSGRMVSRYFFFSRIIPSLDRSSVPSSPHSVDSLVERGCGGIAPVVWEVPCSITERATPRLGLADDWAEVARNT